VISVEKLVVGWSNNWLSESHQSNQKKTTTAR